MRCKNLLSYSIITEDFGQILGISRLLDASRRSRTMNRGAASSIPKAIRLSRINTTLRLTHGHESVEWPTCPPVLWPMIAYWCPGETYSLTFKREFPYTHIFPFHYSRSDMFITSGGIKPRHRRVTEYRVVIPESSKGISGIQEEKVIE